MNCGCTLQRPMCAVGEELFAAIVQSQQKFQAESGEQREKAWEALSLARIAYTDHVHGWRQGDMRIRQGSGIWLLERRHQEQWSFQFAMPVEETLRAWLKGQRFWRYAQIDGGEPQDRLTGYYHRRNTHASQNSTDFRNTSPITGLLWQDRQRHSPPHAQQTDHLVSAEGDQKTEMALLIAVLVGRFAHPLTIVDRLYLQRKVVHWLLSRGIQQIGVGEMQTIALLIEKASDLREMIDHVHTTVIL